MSLFAQFRSAIHRSRPDRLLWAFAWAVLCASVGSSVVSAHTPTIGGYVKVSETRINGNLFEYVYRATLSNEGPAITGATATVTSLSSKTKIVDGSLTFGAAGSDATVQSSDTFSFRQDRSVPFDPSKLKWTINVTLAPPPNKAPVVNAGSDQITTLSSGINLNGAVRDDGKPVGASLTFLWTQVAVVPAGGVTTFGSANAKSSTASFSKAGIYVLRLTASDTDKSASDELAVLVWPGSSNQAPQVNAGLDQTITLPSGTTLSGTVTDDGKPTGAALTFLWTQVSAVPAGGVTTFGSANAKSSTASFSQAGTYVLRLTANDTDKSASDEITVVANLPINQPPAVNAGADQTTTLPAGVALNGTVTDDGRPTGATLTFLWTQVSVVPAGGVTTFGTATAKSSTASFSKAGTYGLRLTANDTDKSASDELTVVVNPPINLAPQVNAGADLTTTYPAGVTLSGSASDDGLPSGSTLSVLWTQVSGPGTTTFGPASSASSSASFSEPGTYVLRLSANDSDKSATDELTVIVSPPPNQAPIVNAGADQSTTFPSGVAVSATATDDGLPNGSTLSLLWTQLSGPGTITFGSATLAASSASFSQPGTYVVHFTATDSDKSTSDDLTVVVDPPINVGPTVDAGVDQTVTFPSGATLSGAVNDDGYPFGSTLTSQWTQTSGQGTATFAGTASAGTTVSFSQPGVYVLRLSSTDTDKSVFDEVSITVSTPSNLAPVVTAGTDQTITLPAGASLTGTVSDDGLPSGATVSSAWTVTSGPGTVTFSAANAPITNATFSVNGTYVLRLSSSDTSQSAHDELSIEVNPVPPPNNAPPQVDAGSDQSITLPTAAGLSGSASDDGQPTNTLTFSWRKVDGQGDATFTPANALVSSASFTQPGTYILELRATDGVLASVDTVTVIAAAPTAQNTAPSVNAGTDQEVSFEQGASMAGIVSDDAKPTTTLQLTWLKSSGPGQVTFADATAASTNATFTAPGVYVLTLTASDTELSTTDDVAVTVAEPLVQGDRAPPIVTLAAPKEALPGAVVELRALANDDVAVAAVRFEVDGQQPEEKTQPPYTRQFTVPQLAEPGTAIQVKAIARDTSNNNGEAAALVSISVTPDGESPTVQLLGPLNSAPGRALRLIAKARDNVGVTSVTFLVNGIEVTSDPDSPYEATYLVPANAPLGTPLSALAQARDYASNVAESVLSIEIVDPANADATPPDVHLIAPDQALPGSTIAIAASATDAGGVAGVAFRAGALPLATDQEPPYETSFAIPLLQMPGTTIEIAAEATDFAALTAAATKSIQIVAPTALTEAAVTGEVYDDTTSLPLAGATVALVGTDGSGQPYTQTSTSDSRGRYLLVADAGSGIVQIRKSGWTSSDRAVTLVAGQAIEAFDARLTPLREPAQTISPALGGTVGSNAKLVLPAGALAQATPLQVVRIGQQGLQGLLPYGWSPVGGADIAPHGLSFTGQATLQVSNSLGVGALPSIVVVRWDEFSKVWRLVGGARQGSGNTLEADVTDSGQFVFAVADVQPLAPPVPSTGDPLQDVAPPTLPITLATAITPQPQILFYRPGAFSEVSGQVTATPDSLTSGAPFVARLSESYQFYSGAEARPEPLVEDLIFFQKNGQPSSLGTKLTVTPSLDFDPLSLERGVISVDLFADATSAPIALVGASGGRVDGPQGASLFVPVGAVNGASPMVLSNIDSNDVGQLPAGLSFVHGVQFFVASALARGANLTIPLPAGVTTADDLLLVRLQDIQSSTRLVLAGVVRIANGLLVADTQINGQQTALPGVREAGRYVFVRAAVSLGFAGGLVRGVTATPFPGALITVGGFGIVSLSNPAGAYLSAAPAGTTTLTATDLTKSDVGTATTFLTAGVVLPVGLELVAQPPRVLTVAPAANSQSAPLTGPVVITFSEAIDPVSVAGANLAHVLLADAGGARLDGTASLSQSNTVLTFRPTQALAPNARYTLTLATGIQDTSGYGLASPFVSSFDTLDTNPPPPPAAGALSASIPNAQGLTTVSGTQGTAAPTDRVFVDNLTRKTIAVALVDPNGSFITAILAGITDKLRVRILDAAGNETSQDLGGFKQINADGSVSQAVFAEGGVVESADGVRATIKPGTFPDGAVVTLKSVPLAQFPLPLSPDQQAVFNLDGAAEIDFGGAVPQNYVDLAIPVVGGETDKMRWIVGQQVIVQGQTVFSVVDTGKFRDGRITTASPPCPGVRAAARYGFVRSQQSVGLNYSRVYSGIGRSLMVTMVSGLMGGLAGLLTSTATSMFAIVSALDSDLLCYPVLSSTATLTPNRTQVSVEGKFLTPSDRLLTFTNMDNPSVESVTLARDVAEFVFDLPGRSTDDYRVVVKGLDPQTGAPAPAHQAGKVTVSTFGAGVRVRVNPDGIPLAATEFVITNLTSKTDKHFAQTLEPFNAGLSGGDGDRYEVTITNYQQNARKVLQPITAAGSPFGHGNLVLRIEDGALDPETTRIDLSNGPDGVQVDMPANWQQRGGLDFAFDGDADVEWTMVVHYSHRPPLTIILPRFTLTVTDPVLGKVLKTISAFAPPPGEPQGLPLLSGDDRAPYVISSPSRLSNFDPSGQLVFTFSEPMDAASLKNAVVLKDSKGNKITGTVQLSGGDRVMRFIPSGGLKLGETYTFEIKGNDASGSDFPPTATPSTPKGAARDKAHNVMPAFKIDIKTYTPEAIGYWPPLLQSGTASVPAFKDIVVPPSNAMQAKADKYVFATTAGPNTNVVLFDVSDPFDPRFVNSESGPVGRQQGALVPSVAFKNRLGLSVVGDLLLTTRFDPQRSGLDIQTMTTTTDANQQQYVTLDPPVGAKVLTENPDLVGFATRHNTVFGDGLAKAVGFIRGLPGGQFDGGTLPNTAVTAYVAVEHVGVMAVDIAQSIPTRMAPERIKEGVYSGNFVDLVVENNQIFAIERFERRMVVLAPDLAELGVYNFQKTPRTIKVVSGVTFDTNNDGFLTPEETYRFAYVGLDDGILIVNVTDLTAISGVGFVPLLGTVKDIDVDAERRRAFILLDRGSQFDIGMVDVTNPFLSALIDTDFDKEDDRLIWSHFHAGANGIRIDSRRGLLYVAGFNRFEVWAAYDTCCDLAVDLNAAPKVEVTGERLVLAERERAGLTIGIEKGLAAAASSCGVPETEIHMLDTGSGGCLWSGQFSCGILYKPGVGTHEFNVFVPSDASTATGVESRATCVARKLLEEFVDPRSGLAKPIKVDGIDVLYATPAAVPTVSFRPLFEDELRAARYGVQRIDDRLPRTIASDFGFGRQALLLRQALSGHWVKGFRVGTGAAGAPIDLTGATTFEILLSRLRTGAGIARIEGYELVKLAQYQMAKAQVYLRFVGASAEASSLNGLYTSQLSGAANAALQAALGRMVADAEGRRRLLSVTRVTSPTDPPSVLTTHPDDNGGLPILQFDLNACLIPEPTKGPEVWTEGKCQSFEEYIFSSAARTLRSFGGLQPLQLFDAARINDQILRFYRVKAGLEVINDERKADEFIRLAHDFVLWALGKTQFSWNADLPLDPDRSTREDNLTFTIGETNEALAKFTTQLTPRVANRGFTTAPNVKVNMFSVIPGISAGGSTSTVEDAQTRLTLTAASEQFLDYRRMPNGQLQLDSNDKTIPIFMLGPVSQTANPGGLGYVAFTIDLPDRTVKESDRTNNVGGTFFYVLDTSPNAGPPPGTGNQIPSPYGPASLLGDNECLPDKRLSVLQTLVWLPQAPNALLPIPLGNPATLTKGQNAELRIAVKNTSAIDATKEVTVCNTLTGGCRQLQPIPPGQESEAVFPVTTATDGAEGTYDVISTAYSGGTGVARSGTLRVSVTCSGFSLVGVDQFPNAISSVMRGGTSYRHFRLMDIVAQRPEPFATIKVTVRGANAGNYIFMTDEHGYVGRLSGGVLTPGVAIPFGVTGGQEGSANVDVEMVHNQGQAGSQCTNAADKVTYLLDFQPFSASHSLKAGGSLSQALQVGGVKASVGGTISLSFGATRSIGDLGTIIAPFSVTRGVSVKAGLSFEPKLFSAGVSAGASAGVESGGLELGAEISGSLGDTFEFKDPALMTQADKDAMLGILVDSTKLVVRVAAPRYSWLLNYLPKRLSPDSRRTARSLGIAAALNASATLFKARVGLVSDDNPGSATAAKGKLAADLGLSVNTSRTIGLSFDHQIFPNTLGTKLKIGMSGGFEAGLTAGFRKASSDVDVKETSAEKKEERFQGLNKLKTFFTLGASGSAAGELSLGVTTPYFFEPNTYPLPAHITGIDRILPTQISFGASLSKSFGWQTATDQANPNKYVKQITGKAPQGSTYSFSMNIATKDLVRRYLGESSLSSVVMTEEQRNQLPTYNTPLAPPGPQSVSDDDMWNHFGNFVVAAPDATFSKSIETGNGIELPLGFDLSFLGSGGETKGAIKFDETVSYPIAKGILKDGRFFVTEEYPEGRGELILAPMVENLVSDALVQFEGLVHRAFTQHGGGLEDGAASFAGGPSSAQPGSSRIEIPGRLRLDLGSGEAPGNATDVVSFDFEEVSGPLAPARYMPDAMRGPAVLPHYGVGGVHEFRPIEQPLLVPAQLTLFYNDAETTPAEEPGLRIYRWSETAEDWILVGGTVDPTTNSVTADITQLGTFTIAPVIPSGSPSWTVLDLTTSGSGSGAETTVRLKTAPILNNDGSPVGAGLLVDVLSVDPDAVGADGALPLGEILNADADPLTQGIQVVTATDGTVEVTVKLPGRPAAFGIDSFALVGTTGGKARIAIPIP